MSDLVLPRPVDFKAEGFEDLLRSAQTQLELLGRIIACLDRTHRSESKNAVDAIAELRAENNDMAQALQAAGRTWPIKAKLNSRWCTEGLETEETQDTHITLESTMSQKPEEANPIEQEWPSEWPDGPLELMEAPAEYEENIMPAHMRMQACTPRVVVTGRGSSDKSLATYYNGLRTNANVDMQESGNRPSFGEIEQLASTTTMSSTYSSHYAAISGAKDPAAHMVGFESLVDFESVEGEVDENIFSQKNSDNFPHRREQQSMISASEVPMYTPVELWPVWSNIKMRRRPRRNNSPGNKPTLGKQRSKNIRSKGSTLSIGRSDSLAQMSVVKQLSRMVTSGQMMSSKSRSEDTNEPESLPMSWSDRIKKNMVASPMSLRRLLWDITGMILIGYDLIVIPLQSFDPPETRFSEAMGFITTIFWTLDIVSSFLVGYHTDGCVEMRVSQIARRYMKTWFFFDVVVVFIDWMTTVLDVMENKRTADTTDKAGFLRFSKSVRFLRMLRLLRLVKVHGMLADILEHVQSEFFRIILGIVKLIVLITLANHVIACGFFWIGRIDESYTFTWVNHFDLMERDLAYRYFTSLHWSLTQFTPASMEIVPRNALERAYTACVILLAMVTFSSFISSLTNAMTQLRNLNSDKIAQHSMLRRYLKQNVVNTDLAARIWVSVQSKEGKLTRRLHEKDVSILEALPSTLHTELRDHIFLPQLTAHPFFFQFTTYHRKPMRKVHKCLSEIFVGLGKELFQGAEDAKCMYFVFQGRLAYNVDTRISSKHDLLSMQEHIQWLVEPVLWIRWKHCGQMVGVSNCELLALSASEFHLLMQHDSPEATSCARYAKLFAANAKSNPMVVNDVWADFDRLQELAQDAFIEHEEDFGSAPSSRSVL